MPTPGCGYHTGGKLPLAFTAPLSQQIGGWNNAASSSQICESLMLARGRLPAAWLVGVKSVS